jgi:hypothetical protein
MPDKPKTDNFSTVKTIIERQIINVLDFLFTDNQITEIEVVKISRYVLKNIDSTNSISNLFKQTRQFVNQYPLFKSNLQKTITALNKSYVS